jgi:hypothetical protein
MQPLQTTRRVRERLGINMMGTLVCAVPLELQKKRFKTIT